MPLPTQVEKWSKELEEILQDLQKLKSKRHHIMEQLRSYDMKSPIIVKKKAQKTTTYHE